MCMSETKATAVVTKLDHTTVISDTNMLETTAVVTEPAHTTVINTACPKCGKLKETGQLSCCFRGGAWFKQCGNTGDSKHAHTWLEGIQACKSKLTC